MITRIFPSKDRFLSQQNLGGSRVVCSFSCVNIIFRVTFVPSCESEQSWKKKPRVAGVVSRLNIYCIDGLSRSWKQSAHWQTRMWNREIVIVGLKTNKITKIATSRSNWNQFGAIFYENEYWNLCVNISYPLCQEYSVSTLGSVKIRGFVSFNFENSRTQLKLYFDWIFF